MSDTRTDGRIEPAEALTDPRFANDDLVPVPVERRTWGTYNYLALCVAQEKTRTLARGADLRVRPVPAASAAFPRGSTRG